MLEDFKLRVFVTNEKKNNWKKTNQMLFEIVSFNFFFKAEAVDMVMHANRMFMEFTSIIGNNTELFTSQLRPT